MSFVAGDTGSSLRVTCRDDDTGTTIDLTGSSVRLQWDDETGTLQSRAMTVVDALGGEAEYQFDAADLVAGVMRFEVEITNAAGKVLRSLSLLRETVRDALD